jgi:hypothetical protein
MKMGFHLRSAIPAVGKMEPKGAFLAPGKAEHGIFFIVRCN